MPQWPLARSRKAYPAFESSAPGGRAPGLSRGWGFKSSGRGTRPSGNHLDPLGGEPRTPRRLPALGADSSRALPGGYAAFPPRREPGPPGVQQRLRRKAYPAAQAEGLTPHPGGPPKETNRKSFEPAGRVIFFRRVIFKVKKVSLPGFVKSDFHLNFKQ